MKKRLRRLLILILVMAMVLSMFQTTALAVEAESSAAPVAEETGTVEDSLEGGLAEENSSETESLDTEDLPAETEVLNGEVQLEDTDTSEETQPKETAVADETIPQGQTEASGEKTQMEDTEEPAEDRTEQGEDTPAEPHVITNFGELAAGDSRIYCSIRQKPSLDELVSTMPDTLDVYLDGSSTATAIEVSWFCVGEDYETSEGYYFQFSPTWDEEKYVLSDKVDLLTEAPYVAVFFSAASANSGIATMSVTSSSNEETIFSFLVNSIGFNSAAACGILANIYYESAFDPNATGDSGTSYGICQWHDTRWTAMKTWCNNNGYDWKTLTGQLNYLKFELSQNNSDYLWNGKTIYNYMIAVEDSAEGAYDAGHYWCVKYEVPANSDTVSVTRGNLAKNQYWPEYGKCVVISSLTNTDQGVAIQWGAIKGTYKYRVYRRSGDSSWEKVGDTTTTSYTDTTVTSGTLYYYTVRCLNSDGTFYSNSFDQTGKSITYLSQPAISSVANSATGVTVTWGKVTGAVKYRVFHRVGSGSWVRVCDTTSTSCVDTTVQSGTTYVYTVRCISSDGTEYTSSYDTAGKTITYLAAPAISSLSGGSTGITIKWGAVTGAVKYRVFRRVDSGSWVRVSDTTSTSCVDTGVQEGTTYVYTVRCINSDGTAYTSGYNAAGKTITYLPQPAISSVANSATGVTVKWGEVTGAVKYRVFHRVGSGSWVRVCDTTSTSCVDTTVQSGTTYVYTVRCVNSDGTEYTSSYDAAGKTITYLAAPAISSVANSTTGVTVTWGEVTGAVKYRVFHRVGSGSWVRVCDTTSTSCVDTTVQSGTTYVYTVRCVNSDGTEYTSSYDAAGQSIIYLATPEVTSAANLAAGVTVKWEQVAGASGYYIYRKTASGNWGYVDVVSGGSTLSYADTAVQSENGMVYTYTVRAYSGKTLSSFMSGKTVCRLTTPSISSATNSGSGQVTVNWNQNSAATGYQVCYRLGTANQYVTIKSASTLSAVITGLTKGETYGIYVRSYKTVSGVNYFSGWSGRRDVKIAQ